MRPVCRVVGCRYRLSGNAERPRAVYLFALLLIRGDSIVSGASVARPYIVSQNLKLTFDVAVASQTSRNSLDAAVYIRTDSLRGITASPVIQQLA